MIVIALATLRLRWLSFVGTFVALALGSALMAALGLVLATTVTAPDRPPARYSAVPVVVAADQTLTVPTWRGGSSAPLAEPRGVPASVVAALPDAVVDRVFPAFLDEDGVGRPWSALGLAGQRLLSGRAPAADDEIAVDAGDIGASVPVVTAGGLTRYTIVGIVSRGPEAAVFFTDARAAALSPRVDALAVTRPVDEVRALVGDRALVLTGQDRARLDASRAADARARNNANTVVGIALGFAAFVAIFVVASTFAFAVTQRRAEFALLRATGASPGQLRRMVYCEALLVAVVASALGALGGPPLGRVLLGYAAPSWITDLRSYDWPLWTAFGTGTLVALLGSLAAAWRASRVRPGEALRSAVVESRTMPLTRWVLGGGTLLFALVTMAVTAIGDPASATNRKTYMPVVMLLVAAAGLLAPALVRPVTSTLVAPLSRLRGAAALVASTAATASARRTAAIAAPVLVTVGLAASLLTASALTDTARVELRKPARDTAFLVVPKGAGLDRGLTAALPGAELSTPTAVYTLEGETVLIRRPAAAVTWVADDEIMVAADWELRPGDTAHVWLADGSRADLRVTGVLPTGSDADAYVGAGRAFTARPSVAYVPTGDRAHLSGLAAEHNARVVTSAEFASLGGAGNSASRTGLLVVLAIVLGYTVLNLVNTLLMAAPDRLPERRTLVLLGASRPQVLRTTILEVLIAVAVGVVLAALCTVVSVAGLWLALLRVTGPLPLTVPWPIVGAITLASVVLAAVTSALGTAGSRRA
ncbi:FtsX-like permease family protein [Dactylosporangium sp. AC04546]|uniref:ABC transporter permease n=1 Tax=Dactylosporangium sp. AC04546 TaxID=2862460 RepID=UPI001EDE8BA6|nr:FtsX-like permease family protein [Dactylosporangium sp. AC04546]WVK84269.1 FtsX-like permease family protein [Dactylosporangium sp. AC04546]